MDHLNPYLELEEIVNLAARDDSTAIEVLKEAANLPWDWHREFN